MLNLVPQSRWFETILSSTQPLDEAFDEMLKGTPLADQNSSSAAPSTFAPAVEAYVDNSEKLYHFRITIPGVDPSDVNVQVQGRVLTVSGERKFNHGSDHAEMLYSELSYGSFARAMAVPQGINLEQIKAEYRNGILDITAPLDASKLPRQIPVHSAPEVESAPEPKQMGA